MSFQDLLTQDRRLVILRLLQESPGYQGNLYLIQTALEGFGHSVGHDRLRQDFAWLAEQSLVAVDLVAGVEIAKLTPRGNDVAAGRSIVPGVKRPVPGA